MDASQIGKRAWSYAGVLQDAGLSCFEYVEQLTLLLFLKMRTRRLRDLLALRSDQDLRRRLRARSPAPARIHLDGRKRRP